METGGSGKRLLLIEDDLFTRELYFDILSSAGCTVTSCADGEVGLFKAKQGGFFLILLDLVMPKVDGLEFLAEYSKLKLKEKNGPVVVFTNLAHDPIIKRAIELGAKGYLIKADLNPDQLIKEVKSYIS